MIILNLVFQLFYLSGILTVFFCGIVMSHYTWHNVTESSRITTKYVNFVISFLDSEIHLFIFVTLMIIEAAIFPVPFNLADMLLQHYHLSQRFSYSYMLVWMPWTSRSGQLLARGKVHQCTKE